MKDCRLFILVMSVELYEFVILEYFCSIIYDFGLFKILVGWLIWSWLQKKQHLKSTVLCDTADII